LSNETKEIICYANPITVRIAAQMMKELEKFGYGDCPLILSDGYTITHFENNSDKTKILVRTREEENE
jgi:hypothetical protein